MENIPLEMFREILVRVPIDKISGWCRSKKFFMGLCRNKYFWQDYIAGDQERLHQLLVELARQGDFNLFSWLWKTPICISLECKTQLIKERRSLLDGFNAAYNGGYGDELVADKIWNIEPEFFLLHFDLKTSAEDEFLKSDVALKAYKILMRLRQFAKDGNEMEFKELYKASTAANESDDTPDNFDEDDSDTYREIGEVAMSDDEEISHIVEIWIGEILGAHSKDFNFLRWGTTLIGRHETYISEAVIDYIIEAGRLDLFASLQTYFPETDINILKVLESSNPNAVQFINQLFPYDKITPLSLDEGNIRGLGNRDILLNHMATYPKDLKTLLLSERTLEAKEFINLLKATLANNSKTCLTRRVRDNFMGDNEREGRDYLSYLFNAEIPRCPPVRRAH